MLIWLSTPPHPSYQGGIEKNSHLFDIWEQRLKNFIPLDSYWIKHQNRLRNERRKKFFRSMKIFNYFRDEYWRHGSISEDYSKILCPVLLIGGFADLYNSSIFRLINQLKCSKRAILGPWGHQWPFVFFILFK